MEDDLLDLRLKKKKAVPFDFVFDLLTDVDVETRHMFGCTALYVGPKIVLILREKKEHAFDNGVWVATTFDHHPSLKKEFPTLRNIRIFGKKPTVWQNLPSSSPGFEEAVTRICELINQRDPRIGKIPERKKKKRAT